jgi:hypothetical protein
VCWAASPPKLIQSNFPDKKDLGTVRLKPSFDQLIFFVTMVVNFMIGPLLNHHVFFGDDVLRHRRSLFVVGVFRIERAMAEIFT